MLRILLILLLSVSLLWSKSYHLAQEPDFERLLPPPPALESKQGQAELTELHLKQSTRTPQQIAFAKLDDETSVFRFADVLGTSFRAETLPETAKLFDRVKSTGKHLIKPVKKEFARLRPFEVDSSLHPIFPKDPGGASYPSKHALTGYLFGILLAQMVPEQSVALLERARIYANNRIIAGVHYPSDVEAGRICAQALVQSLLADPGFQKDFAQAKQELRTALALGQTQ